MFSILSKRRVTEIRILGSGKYISEGLGRRKSKRFEEKDVVVALRIESECETLSILSVALNNSEVLQVLRSLVRGHLY